MKSKLALLFLLSLSILSYTQLHNSYYQSLVNQVDGQNTINYLTDFLQKPMKK